MHLAGTLQAGETATIDLGLTDISTTSADYASFSGGGDGSDRRPHRSELQCRHRHADLHRQRQPDGQSGDQPGCGPRQLGGRPRTIHGCAEHSGQHHGQRCGRHRLGDHHHHRHRHGDLVDQRRHRASPRAARRATRCSWPARCRRARRRRSIWRLTDISTTSADYASFAAAVTAAIGGRTDLSFDAGTGTLTYTGDGSPMANLVINLGAVHDSLVEGPEQYTVALSTPGSTTGALLGGTGSVDHHHHRHRHGDLVDQRRHRRHRGRHGELHGAPGRHAAGGRDGDGRSGDHRYQHHQRGPCASFSAAVTAAIGSAHRHLSFNAGTGTLTYTGDRQPDGQSGDQPGCGPRQSGGRPRKYTVALSTPGSTTGRRCGCGTGSVTPPSPTPTRRPGRSPGHRRRRGRHGELHGAPGRHAAGGRDGDGRSGVSPISAPPALTMRASARR